MDLIWGFYLGWDWNPVIFLILLGLSILLASKVKGWPVLWLLPAWVLYAGLNWDMPGPLMLLFELAFWIGVLVALVTAFLPGSTRLAKLAFNLMVGLLVVLLVIAMLTGAWDLVNGSDRPEGEAVDVCETIDGAPDSEVQEKVPDGYGVGNNRDCVRLDEPDDGPPPKECPNWYEQRLDPNRQFRFESNGFKGTPRQKRAQFITALAHDYRYLAFVAEALFQQSIDRNRLYTMVGGESCLSQAGRRLHREVKGALMASGIRTGQAPSNAFNTGMKAGHPVVAKQRGIYGDRTATVYRLPDGSKLVVLDRCGNIVLLKKPERLLEGPTDNPPPPPPPQQPPSPPSEEGGCVEIPGNGVYDCGGKDPAEEPAQQGNVPGYVTGSNPGTGGAPASQPSAQPPKNYNPPPSGGGGSGGNQNPPPPEPGAPPPDQPEPPPSSDPCQENPDFC